MIVSTISLLGVLASFAAGEYVLVDDYSPQSLFTNFTFFTEPDPTEGFVKYVGESDARDAGLIDVKTGTDGEPVAYMAADSTNFAPDGRKSIRITSKKTYNQSLVIADLAHVPETACGTWPAFWMFGPDWPNGGEIDIYEGVNMGVFNGMALHTGANCSITPLFGRYTATMKSKNCDVKAPDQDSNQGCQFTSINPESYGSGANKAGGGVIAMEWVDTAVTVWYFPRNLGIPEDITSGNPQPNSWGVPEALFTGDCRFDKKFRNLQIVFNITFCGHWAGADWTLSPCSALMPKCEDFVEKMPGAYKDSYWEVKSVKVYQEKPRGLTDFLTKHRDLHKRLHA